MVDPELVEKVFQKAKSENKLSLFGDIDNLTEGEIKGKIAIHLSQSNIGGVVKDAPVDTILGSGTGENDMPSIRMLRLTGALDPDTLTDTSPEAIRAMKRRMKRQEAIGELMVGMVTSRVDPGPSSNIQYITFEQFTKLQEEYAHYQAEGLPDNKQDFLPFSVYGDKFFRMGIVTLQNEVGRFQMTKRPQSKLVGKIAVIRDREFSTNTVVVGGSKGTKTQDGD